MKAQCCLLSGDDFAGNELGECDDVEVVDSRVWVHQILAYQVDDFLAQSERLDALNLAIIDGIEMRGCNAERAEKGVGRFDQGWDPILAHCSCAKDSGACDGVNKD